MTGGSGSSEGGPYSAYPVSRGGRYVGAADAEPTDNSDNCGRRVDHFAVAKMRTWNAGRGPFRA